MLPTGSPSPNSPPADARPIARCLDAPAGYRDVAAIAVGAPADAGTIRGITDALTRSRHRAVSYFNAACAPIAAATNPSSIRIVPCRSARSAYHAAGYFDLSPRAPGSAADTRSSRIPNAFARSGHRAARSPVSTADASTIRSLSHTHARSVHRAAEYLDFASAATDSAPNPRSVCHFHETPGIGKALRREGAASVNGHGRPVSDFQTGAVRAADEGVRGAFRQLDARRSTRLDLERTVVAVDVAAHIDLDARKRDIRGFVGRGHHDATGRRLRGVVLHGHGHGRARQEPEHVACVGVVRPFRTAHHHEVARRDGDRVGVVFLIGHRVVAHGQPLEEIDAVDLAVSARARSEQATRDFRRGIDLDGARRLDATARYLDGAAGAIVATTDAGTTRKGRTLARSSHRATGYLDVPTGASGTAADAGPLCLPAPA